MLRSYRNPFGPSILVLVLVLVLALALMLPVSVTAAQGSERSEDSDEKKAEVNQQSLAAAARAAKGQSGSKVPRGKVYTNEDLQRLFGGESLEQVDTRKEPGAAPAMTTGPGDAKKPAAQVLPDPLQQMEDRKRQQQDQAKAIAEARQNLAAAQQKVADLEQRAKAIRNPYLPIPQDAPDGAEQADKDEWKGLGTAGRLDRTEKSLEAAREAVRKAEQELAAARRSR